MSSPSPSEGATHSVPREQARPQLLNRRQLLVAASLVTGAGVAAASIDGVAVEPMEFARVARYEPKPSAWPTGLRVSIAVIADLHACEPWMSVARIEHIVHATNAIGADAIVLLGDYVAGHDKITAIVPDADWAHALGSLRAPLGVYAILGNHDWWNDERAQLLGRGPIGARRALEKAGIRVLENDSVKLSAGGRPFWIAGLGDQMAFPRKDGRRSGDGHGVADLSATLDGMADDAPVVLLVHEPDIFPQVPERVAVTLAGHTHGGQIRLFGRVLAPASPLSRIYNYGHFVEGGRHMIVSGGLGCSRLPLRLGVPPEILHVVIAA